MEEEDKIKADDHADYEERKYKKEEEQLNPPNFVNKLAWSIYEANPIVHFDVSLSCASTLLNSVLPYVRIKTRLGYLPLAEMNLVIGASGTSKTMPFKIVKDVLTELGLKLPEKYTTEGIEAYFARRRMRDVLDRDGRVVRQEETDEYENPPYGTMVIDEISQMFKESKSKEYLSGSIEQMAQFYDMDLKSTALSARTRRPQSPYICLIAGTVPEAIIDLPKFIFSQGLAGRFHWIFIEPQKTAPEIEIMDYGRYKQARTGIMDVYYDTLKKLFELNVHPDFNPDLKPLEIRIDSKASKRWHLFHMEKYAEWYQQSINNPYGYDWQYLRRLPELVLRQAGTFAVGRGISSLKLAKKGKHTGQDMFNLIEITEGDINKAIERVDVYEKNLKKILRIHITGIVYTMGTARAKGEVYNVDNLIVILLKNKRRLNLKQLHDLSKISDYKTFTNYVNKGIRGGLMKKWNKKDITVQLKKEYKNKQDYDNEISRLHLDKNVKVIELTDEV